MTNSALEAFNLSIYWKYRNLRMKRNTTEFVDPLFMWFAMWSIRIVEIQFGNRVYISHRMWKLLTWDILISLRNIFHIRSDKESLIAKWAPSVCHVILFRQWWPCDHLIMTMWSPDCPVISCSWMRSSRDI